MTGKEIYTMPNIFCMGGGAFGQTLYTWDVFNVTSSTSYTAQKRLAINDNGTIYAYQSTSLVDLFGFDTFYVGTGVTNDALDNAVEAVGVSTFGDLEVFASNNGGYIQPADDYLGDSKENIFTISSASVLYGVYVYRAIGYETRSGANVPVLPSATTPATVASSASATMGWNDNDGYYYSDLTSVTVQEKGASTGNTVTSYNANAYPADGIQGAYWYVRQ